MFKMIEYARSDGRHQGYFHIVDRYLMSLEYADSGPGRRSHPDDEEDRVAGDDP